MFEDKYAEFEKFIAENKGKRKFKQSVELAINFKEIDFTKQDNRLNLDITLPNGRGKVNKVGIFSTDRNVLDEARRLGIEAISGEDIPQIASEKPKLESLVNYDLLAQPSLMPTIAKYLGQFLGPRDRMPKPMLPGMNLERTALDIGKHISIKSKGKFLPTVHCIVGGEDMETSKTFANIQEVMNSVVSKVGETRIKSVFVKLTMSKPIRLM
jgi:large subunit ribosomal protein L1